ncbi:MAG TPA: TIGR03936 family radical SAM-associated protein [Pirellulales bacterium]
MPVKDDDPIEDDRQLKMTATLKTMNPPEATTRLRARIRFTKLDDLRWIGHRDLMRVWERLFRRAGVLLSMTEGFHPKPRINFPSALAVGIAGTDELVEVDFAALYTAEALREIIAPELPPGMALGAIEILPGLDHKAQVKHVTFTLEIPPPRQPALAERLVWLMAHTSLLITREGRTKPLDLRPLIDRITLENDTLHLRLRVDREGSARPREVLDALQIADLEFEGYFLTRTSVEIE